MHKGRVSLAGARYFVTCSARRPESRLVDALTGRELQLVLVQLEGSDDYKLLCSTIMPDHIHLILRLIGRLSVGQVVGKFKALCRKCEGMKGIEWQRDFFEHRLRPEDNVTGFARYVYMNPYRERLISGDQVWPWWQRGEGECVDLAGEFLNGMFPPEEWMSMNCEQMGVRVQDVGEERASASNAPTKRRR